MKKPLSIARLACAGLLAMAAAGCGAAATAPAAVDNTAAARKALDAALLANAACDAPDQCRTVGLGHKACGGPESYAAYSVKGGNDEKIRMLAQQYADARKRDDEAAGRMSTCMATRDPGATCSAQRCVTGPSGKGTAAY
jgi:guanyl-specific ribonuclease Sa